MSILYGISTCLAIAIIVFVIRNVWFKKSKRNQLKFDVAIELLWTVLLACSFAPKWGWYNILLVVMFVLSLVVAIVDIKKIHELKDGE